ncbi:glycosyl transferase family 2 [sediment metagenome]|uniref:Glycosyl transferase family 2 n=1 Tax=sediment metagenome TaxID=749907 RepID=D9PM56_9ZZZZ
MVGNLATGEGIPEAAFDCMIITQTYQMIYDVASAVFWTYSALKPSGILLATLPGISQISRYDMDRWGDYWRFTDTSARRLFYDVFGEENVTIETYGNVLTAIAFLHGLSAKELRKKELSYHDPDYQLLITVRAVKARTAP